MLLQEIPAVPLLEKLCEEHGHTYHWKSGLNPHLTQKDKRIDCNILNYVSFEVRELSTSSSTSSTSISSSSSSQDSVIDTENPAAERSGSMSVELRRNSLPDSENTTTQIKMKETKKYRAIYCMNCRIDCRRSQEIWLMKMFL